MMKTTHFPSTWRLPLEQGVSGFDLMGLIKRTTRHGANGMAMGQEEGRPLDETAARGLVEIVVADPT
ncbi:hypothetical protein BaRGS_00003370 [Batillaria attramentaria]|uniref:Uncharacterized protein n=1 Tax=Batillaria attramentaria TaxID=370345 RepID=A0ABD0M0G6_9CAEN